MEVCDSVENISNVDASKDTASSRCSSVNVSSEASIEYMVGECLKQKENIEQGPKEDTNVCLSVREVSHADESKHSVRQAVYEVCPKYDKDIVSSSYPHIVKSSVLSEEVLNLNDNSNKVCNIQSSVHNDCDAHSDSLNNDQASGGPEIVGAETCDLHSVGESAYSENVTSQCSDKCSEGDDINSLDTNDLHSLSEEIVIKNEIEAEVNEYGKELNVTCSKIDEKESQYFENIAKSDVEFPSQCHKDQTFQENGSNDDSDTVSADEREEKNDTLQQIDKSENTSIKSCLTTYASENRKISSHSYVNKKDKINASFSGRVLYKCIKCNFSHKKLEQLSLHVLTCSKKRKYGRNQAYRIDGEVPSKTRFLFTDSKTNLASNVQTKTQSQACTTTQLQLGMLVENPEPPATQTIVLTHSQDPVTTKPQFIITPQTQLLASSQSSISSPKTQLLGTSNSQFVVASQTQLPSAQKAMYAITTKSPFTSMSKSQFVISAQSQVLGTSKSQVTIASPSVTTTRSEITSAQTNNPFFKTTQPIVSLQTPLPTVSSAEFTSLSKTQISTVPQGTLSIPPGAKITIGPQTEIPIVPHAPLTLSPQGNLTISQSGSQLLITTKPVQQNTGTSNKPTLLGLGIGTSPTVAPKNIVLLPNLLLNSFPSSTGTVNGKQESAPIQGQFISQNANTPDCSAAPLQFQQNLVYSPQSLVSQPQILMSPVYTLPNKSESSGTVDASTLNIMHQPQLAFTLSTSKQSSSAVPESTTNTKLSYQTGKLLQSSKPSTFICEICDDYVNDLEKLRNHMQCLHEINIHPKMMPSFNCQKCQYCFFTEQGLERHLVGSHGLVTAGMQDAADKGKDGGRCPICGWGYQNKLLHHVTVDHKVSLKPADLSYKCTLCTATFTMYKQFEDHVYTAHRPAITKLAQGNSQSSSQPIK